MRTEVVRTALSFLAGTGLGIALTWRFLQPEECDESEEDSDEESDEEESANVAQLRLKSPIRDDYSDDEDAEDEETYKMLLIVNMELYRTSSKDPTKIKKVKMSAGKAAAQASHATLGAYRRAVKQCPRSVSTWLNGQMKITVKCPTVMNTPAACLGSAREPGAATGCLCSVAPSIHRLLIFALLPALLLPHQPLSPTPVYRSTTRTI